MQHSHHHRCDFESCKLTIRDWGKLNCEDKKKLFLLPLSLYWCGLKKIMNYCGENVGLEKIFHSNSIVLHVLNTYMKSGGSQNVSKFQGPKWFKDSGTVVGSSKGPETAEKTGPPCFSRLDKPDWYMIQTVHAKYCILHWIKLTNLQLRAKTMHLSRK